MKFSIEWDEDDEAIEMQFIGKERGVLAAIRMSAEDAEHIETLIQQTLMDRYTILLHRTIADEST